MATVAELQGRIDAALKSEPGESRRFSEYRDSADDLIDALWMAAANGGVAAALDAFDRLRGAHDRHRLQHALMRFIAEHPAAAQAGLRIPSIEQRAPWSVRPSTHQE